jgi:CO/xanthine dehydrogenase FAD-binding subunit
MSIELLHLADEYDRVAYHVVNRDASMSLRLRAALMRSEAARSNELRTALQAMVDAFQPFRSKPMGAPNSDARLQQDAQIAAYDRAVALLSSQSLASHSQGSEAK